MYPNTADSKPRVHVTSVSHAKKYRLFVFTYSETEDFSSHPRIMLSASCIAIVPLHHIWLLSAVTGNHIYRKQAIETGAMY